MFFSANSIEPTDTERKRAKEAPPIREATGAEVAGAVQRRAREDASPVKAAKASSSPVREPDPVAERHGLYTAESMTGRRYYADYQQKSEVMRASTTRISTRLDDKATVSAMLDLAETRGWQSVKLSGSESFRREAWVQAQVRGVATEGYTPRETDRQELARRQNAVERPAATETAAVPVQAAKAIPITASKPTPVEAEAQQAKEKPVPTATAKAARKETAGGSKREGQRPAAAASSDAVTAKAEKPGTHKAEADVWNAVEIKGATAIAQGATLKEKAAIARAAQEQKALAAQASRSSSAERAA